jgi:hypothetical protein
VSNLQMTMQAQRIILMELRRKFGFFTEKGNSAWIRCPMPKHGGTDGTPSFKINLDPNNDKAPIGFGYCFGCGSRAHWNELADAHKMQHLSILDVEVSERAEVAAKLHRVRNRMENLSLDKIAQVDFGAAMTHEVTHDWRGISGKLLKLVGARQIIDKRGSTAMLLPVSVQGNMVGAIKALLEKSPDKKVPSYLNSNGEWAKDRGLFPYDATRSLMKKWKVKKLILGEGPRDSLNALNFRMPAMSVLGVKNWTTKKRDLVLSLDPDELILCMDGDRAGVEATNMLMEEFGRYLPVDFIDTMHYTKKYRKKLDDEKYKADLGDPPDEMLDELIRRIHGTDD